MRHLHYGLPVISLLVALFSVGGLVVPILVKTIHNTRTPNLRHHEHSLRTNSIHLIAPGIRDIQNYAFWVTVLGDNVNTSDALLVQGRFRLEDARGELGSGALTPYNHDEMIPAGNIKLLTYSAQFTPRHDRLPMGRYPEGPFEVTMTKAKVYFETRQFGKSTHAIEVDLPIGRWEVAE